MDADENTIIEGYLKQVDDDPGNMAFYLEYLQDAGYAKTSCKINLFAEEEVNNKKVYTRFDLPVTYVEEEEVDACLNPSTFNVTNLKGRLKKH
jgi:hypothetical protein